MAQSLRIGVLVSGTGTNLNAILDSCEAGRISGEVVFVGSDTPEAAGLQRAAVKGIPTFSVDYRQIIRQHREHPDPQGLPDDFNLFDIRQKQNLFPEHADERKTIFFLESRALAEAELLRHMAQHPFDLLVLAGFMHTLSPYFIDRVSPSGQLPRIMNIHPALLPSFPGTDGYGDTYRFGCKVGGCTVHFVDYGEDSGPIVGQRAFAITPEDSLSSVREKGLKLEWELYTECIELYARDRLIIEKTAYELRDGRCFEKTVVRIRPPRDTGRQ